MHRYLMATLLGLTAALPLAAHPATAQTPSTKVSLPLPADVIARKMLTVGINCQFPPAGYVGLDGNPAGYEYTLVKRIGESAQASGVKLATQCVNDSNRIPFLQSGKVDLVLAGLAVTPSRAEQIGFSEPIWISNLQLVVPKESSIAGYADLGSRSVVTTTGSLYQAWFQKCYPNVRLLTVQSPTEASLMLTQGRVDAFAYIDVYEYNFVRNSPAYKVVGALAVPAIQAIGLRKDNKPLLDWTNAVVDRMRQEDAFYKAFSDEVKNPALAAKYRKVVPGPDVKLEYPKVALLECVP